VRRAWSFVWRGVARQCIVASGLSGFLEHGQFRREMMMPIISGIFFGACSEPAMPRRCFPAWLATLALLTHLLTMVSAGVPVDGERVHTGADHNVHLQAGHAHAEPAPTSHGEHDKAGHAGMLQCCCAGFSGLAALPFDPPRLADRLVRKSGPLPDLPSTLPSPRQQWPALNPRASPLA